METACFGKPIACKKPKFRGVGFRTITWVDPPRIIYENYGIENLTDTVRSVTTESELSESPALGHALGHAEFGIQRWGMLQNIA